MPPNKPRVTKRPSFNKVINQRNSFFTAAKSHSSRKISPYASTGLNHKDRAYIINHCQTKLGRYRNLKIMAANAINDHKIFTVYGGCKTVRKCLVERGWVEKIPERRMTLMRLKSAAKSKAEAQNDIERLFLSSLVQKYPSNFIWRFKDSVCGNHSSDITNKIVTIENRLSTVPLWTSKQGLCVLMKQKHWFYIEDVAEVSSPRAYNTIDKFAINEFDRDYKITACTSILKWMLTKVANNCQIFSKTGKISCNVIIFALNTCKAYLFRKQNRDIDYTISTVSNAKWTSFLKKCGCLIREEAILNLISPEKLPLYVAYARCLLEEIYVYRPQLACEGYHNVWIIKPPHNSRGRGIRMASNLSVIHRLIGQPNTKFVIQKYIEEPVLIHETKFDIRQYCLVTDTCPLTIWMYKDCYLKFSSQKYNLMNFHESIHLTNNAIQRHYKNCEERHPDLPSDNMWHLDRFKSYLDSIGKGNKWKDKIYPTMRKAIIGIMLCSQDTLPISRNRFELFGCDFIIDKTFHPWLIEINSGPDLQHTTSVTSKICPAVIEDMMKVVIDYPRNRRCSTGKFERIYRQPFKWPKYQPTLDLTITGYPLPVNYFYKGTIPTYPSQENERDIKNADSFHTLVNKMKHCRELPQLFKQLAIDDKPINIIFKKSENELTLTTQLFKFMNSMISIGSKDSEKKEKLSQFSIVELSLKNTTSNVSSEIKSIQTPSLSSLDKLYNFCDLYDEVEKSETVLMETLKTFKTAICSSGDEAREATSKILRYFIEKEKEVSKY